MLINRSLKQIICLKRMHFSLTRMFSKTPYFRQMANKLNITIPKLNDEIVVNEQNKCLVYGVRQVAIEQFTKLDEEQTQKNRKQRYFDEQFQLGYVIDKNSRSMMDFGLAKRIAENLQLDICLMQEASIGSSSQETQNLSLQYPQSQTGPILSLTRFRQYVYRQYYLKQLKNRSKKKYLQNQLHNQFLIKDNNSKPKTGSDKNKIKSIRIGEDVHQNDLKNKKNQVENWIQQGQRTIKVIANNDSDKSRKAILTFTSMFDKQVQIVQEKVIPNSKKKPIVRFYAILQFEQQIQVDFDFVNRRWRRREAQIKLTQQGKKHKKSIFDIDFTNEGAEIQRAYLAAFDEAGIPYPKNFTFLNQFDKAFEKQGMMSVARTVMNQNKDKADVQPDEQLSQEQIRIRDRQNRKIMEMRTVQDILEEMEEMKSREYEMEQFQASRYKELQKELIEMMRNARKYAKQEADS